MAGATSQPIGELSTLRASRTKVTTDETPVLVQYNAFGQGRRRAAPSASEIHGLKGPLEMSVTARLTLRKLTLTVSRDLR